MTARRLRLQFLPVQPDAAGGLWSWRLTAPNGEVIARSDQPRRRRRNTQNAVRALGLLERTDVYVPHWADRNLLRDTGVLMVSMCPKIHEQLIWGPR